MAITYITFGVNKVLFLFSSYYPSGASLIVHKAKTQAIMFGISERI